MSLGYGVNVFVKKLQRDILGVFWQRLISDQSGTRGFKQSADHRSDGVVLADHGRPEELGPAVKNRDRDDQTWIAHDVEQEAEHATDIAAVGDLSGLLLDEQTQTIGQLRLLVMIQGPGVTGVLTSDIFLHSVYFWSSRSLTFRSAIVQLYTSRSNVTLPGANMGHTSSPKSSSCK
jgi:hypothetical protein